MLTFHRSLGLGAFAGLGILLAATVTPARAHDDGDACTYPCAGNALTATALTSRALTSSEFILSGSELRDLNGVTVEEISSGH
jgi:hypothetical protein